MSRAFVAFALVSLAGCELAFENNQRPAAADMELFGRAECGEVDRAFFDFGLATEGRPLLVIGRGGAVSADRTNAFVGIDTTGAIDLVLASRQRTTWVIGTPGDAVQIRNLIISGPGQRLGADVLAEQVRFVDWGTAVRFPETGEDRGAPFINRVVSELDSSVTFFAGCENLRSAVVSAPF